MIIRQNATGGELKERSDTFDSNVRVFNSTKVRYLAVPRATYFQTRLER